MVFKLDDGFVEGRSDNLPKVDSVMVAEFFSKNNCFNQPESRGVKEDRSGREQYGDNSVRHVQVKRDSNVCILKSKICPEHRVTSKNYNVVAKVDLINDQVTNVTCEDCAASEGGCKHAVAFLMWIHRRSEEPSPTQVQCYWKKSRLAGVGSNIKFLTLADLGGHKPLDFGNTNFRDEVLRASKSSSTLSLTLSDPLTPTTLSMHNLMLNFYTSGGGTYEEFCKFCKINMPISLCEEVEKMTKNQHKCKLWHELRYIRVTASKAYTAAHCKTPDGSFVNSVVGVVKLRDTAQMERGRILERRVISVVEKQLNLKLSECGLVLSGELPFLGATPDSVGNNFIIVVKCPSSSKTSKNYVTSQNKITEKYNAQVQMQMHLLKIYKCYFCVASPELEQNEMVNILEINYDGNYVNNQVSKFWKDHIFPVLHDSVKI